MTYSSHEFDVDDGDYSLARYFAREGYVVWMLDIAGYGLSQKPDDGFLPDSHVDLALCGETVEKLPPGSKFVVIKGGAHAMMTKKTYTGNFAGRRWSFFPSRRSLASEKMGARLCADGAAIFA